MTVSCSAITGYNVYMQFNGGEGGPLDNQDLPHEIDITVTCDSADQVWNYVVTLNGITYTRPITSVTCAELATTTTVLNACSPTLIALDRGDNNNPQINVEVTYSGYSYTAISGSSETMSTMIIRCSAINNYNVFMQFNVNEGGPLVEQFLPQTIAVNVTCNSANQVWIYAAEVSGVIHTRDIRSVACQQAPNACSPTTIMYGEGDNESPQLNVDVTNFGLTSTQIAGTQDSISTMKISCMAIDGYYVNMEFNENGQVKENLDSIQNITVEVTCDSRTMEWIYSSVLDNGDVYTHTVTSAECLQIEETPPLRTCSASTITYGMGDTNNPQQQVDVTNFGLTFTPIAGTMDTTASMSVSCTAIDGYVAYMTFPPNRQPLENGQGADAPQTVTITATCSSVDEVWYYNTILPDGNPYTEAITSVTCTQSITEGPAPCNPDAISYGVGDGGTPEVDVTVSYTNFMSTTDMATGVIYSSMTVTCSAINGYNVYMIFNGGQGGPADNQNMPQSISIRMECNTENRIWNYVVTLNGVTYTRAVSQVDCQQAPN
ncbi:LOW QUALITY PROTEIN: Protein CBG08532, partial [Caenorhabditis briggsae]